MGSVPMEDQLKKDNNRELVKKMLRECISWELKSIVKITII